MCRAARQVTVCMYIPATALQLNIVIYKHVVKVSTRFGIFDHLQEEIQHRKIQ
jgi:hypothetical protein